MRIIKSLSVFILIFVFLSCGSQSKHQSVVKGKVSGLPEQTQIYLFELDVEEIKPVDSSFSDMNGEFNIEFSPEETSFYILGIGSREIPLIVSEGENIKVMGDTSSLSYAYSVSGSQESTIINYYENFTRKNEQKMDSLAMIFESAQGNPGFEQIAMELNKAYDGILDDQIQFVKGFIDMYPDKMASLLVIFQGFGQSRVLDITEDFEYFKKLDGGLMKAYPGNKHVEANHKRLIEFEKKRAEDKKAIEFLMPGNPAPDVTLNDVDDKPVSISSLKGKEVLIYIWGAWDAKSREANKQLLPLYEDYKGKGFEIYAVSIDMYKDMWLDAIELDKLTWINVSDLKGGQSPIIELYKLPDALPFFILVNKEGIIQYRGKNLEEMQDKLTSDLR